MRCSRVSLENFQKVSPIHTKGLPSARTKNRLELSIFSLVGTGYAGSLRSSPWEVPEFPGLGAIVGCAEASVADVIRLDLLRSTF